MASAALLTCLLLLAVALLSVGSDARPCKTLFISYTISSSAAVVDLSQTAASAADQKPSVYLSVYRVLRPLRPSSFIPEIRRPIRIERPVLPAEPADVGVSSPMGRCKDILFVLIALLFGVGCGALTAATLYLAWSLVTSRYEMSGADYDYDDEAADESPKKMGYAKIAGPASTKEGYEGN